MKKMINQLLTVLLTGTMLLGTAGIATAATNSIPTGVPQPTIVHHQMVNTPDRAGMDNKLSSRVEYAALDHANLSAVLSRLAANGTITKAQARIILSKLAANSSIYKLLSRLVANGTISQTQMDAIMSRLLTANMNSCNPSPNALWAKAPLWDKNQKDQPGPVSKTPQQPTNTQATSIKG
jgi:hypothetical protein